MILFLSLFFNVALATPFDYDSTMSALCDSQDPVAVALCENAETVDANIDAMMNGINDANDAQQALENLDSIVMQNVGWEALAEMPSESDPCADEFAVLAQAKANFEEAIEDMLNSTDPIEFLSHYTDSVFAVRDFRNAQLAYFLCKNGINLW